jgi:hypothetical protein
VHKIVKDFIDRYMTGKITIDYKIASLISNFTEKSIQKVGIVLYEEGRCCLLVDSHHGVSFGEPIKLYLIMKEPRIFSIEETIDVLSKIPQNKLKRVSKFLTESSIYDDVKLWIKLNEYDEV